MPRTVMPETPTTVSITVADPSHLCRVQTTTRGFCRSLGLDESSVYEAVIAVTELAHRLFIERSRRGSVDLSAVPLAGRLGLEVRVDDAVVGLFPSMDE